MIKKFLFLMTLCMVGLPGSIAFAEEDSFDFDNFAIVDDTFIIVLHSFLLSDAFIMRVMNAKFNC